MSNPIRNAVVRITKRDLASCKRCGCPDLAWVKFKSGKWGLVQTACRRPFYSGDGIQPEGLYALKFNFHKCEEFLKIKAEVERRNSECHPKASNPAEILADATNPIILQIYANGVEEGNRIMQEKTHPLYEAFHILAHAMTSIQNLNGVKL